MLLAIMLPVHSLCSHICTDAWLTHTHMGALSIGIGTWRQRYFVLKDTCLAYYMDDVSSNPRDALLFDRSFKINPLNANTYYFEIVTNMRVLTVRARR